MFQLRIVIYWIDGLPSAWLRGLKFHTEGIHRRRARQNPFHWARATAMQVHDDVSWRVHDSLLSIDQTGDEGNSRRWEMIKEQKFQNCWFEGRMKLTIVSHHERKCRRIDRWVREERKRSIYKWLMSSLSSPSSPFSLTFFSHLMSADVGFTRRPICSLEQYSLLFADFYDLVDDHKPGRTRTQKRRRRCLIHRRPTRTLTVADDN